MNFTIISIIIISIIGTLSHFMYDITNHNKIIGLFTSVNESTWEHIKIALTPTLLWSLIDGIVYGTNPNYFIAKCVSLIIIIILMPTLFYGYKSIFKKDSFIVNILIFYIVIIFSQLAFLYIISIEPLNFIYKYISCIGIFFIFGGYMIHTLMPAKNFLFKDPISNNYGYKGHRKI
ncbi:MAG: hypothetical protein IJ097_00440 [Bacilli bacterium]|nr:hypothetical protein [Bacilli bacterium]